MELGGHWQLWVLSVEVVFENKLTSEQNPERSVATGVQSLFCRR
jgi:hypothetical protein